MVKNCTSIEQSKRLLELGLNPDTADMIWIEDFLGYDNGKRKRGEYRLYGDMLVPAYGQDSVKAWSLSALFGLMPIIKLNDSEVDCEPKITKTTTGEYTCTYEDEDYHLTKQAKNSIDAVFEMIVWLLKNKKL